MWESERELQKGVYQGNPLSVLVFNTVMHTPINAHHKALLQLGIIPQFIPGKTDLLYADDTSLITNSLSSCKTLLSAIKPWLIWLGMKANNVPKCVSFAIHSSGGKPYNPKLILNSETIPYINGSTSTSLEHLSSIIPLEHKPGKACYRN